MLLNAAWICWVGTQPAHNSPVGAFQGGQEALEEDPKSTSLEDAKIMIEIFKKALEFRPQIKKAVLGKDFEALSKRDRLKEAMTPRISLAYGDEGETIPCLFFRFVGDESPILAATFFPYEAISSFLSQARAWARWISPSESDPAKVEELAVDKAIDMTLIMIDNFYSRGELMMDSFTSEVIAQWQNQRNQSFLLYQAEVGNPVAPNKDTLLDQIVKDYSRKVMRLWKYQGQTPDNWRKVRLAEEYERIYGHWKRLSKMVGEGEEWKEYAKAGSYHDTPDDLLAKLGSIDRRDDKTSESKVSELAIEHSARRVSLIKKRVNESILGKRKKGIKVTGYSHAKLFEFLKRGRDLKAQRKTMEEARHQDEAALEKRAKRLEQNVAFTQSVADEIT